MFPERIESSAVRLGLALMASVWAAGCQQRMADQPRIEPLEPSEFFLDGMGSRQLVPGTVPRGKDRTRLVSASRHFHTAMVGGEVAAQLPPEIDQQWELYDLLVRGRERYEIFCVHCHDLAGTGRGMVPQRGYPQPPTFHSERLRRASLGHIFRVISAGKGKMPAHAAQIPAEDRWAIAAYIRALQFSQHADVSELPPEDRMKLPE